MRKLITICFFTLAILLQNCKRESSEDLDHLEILYFNADADAEGGTVTIVGAGFSLNPAENLVTFNTVATRAFYASPDTLLVKVPEGATSGRIQVTANGRSATSGGIFYVVTGHWKKMSPFPGVARLAATGFSIGNKGYITLGGTGTEFRYLWQYDATTDTWTRKADFPGGDRGNAICFVINNKVYIRSGATASLSTINDFYEYDPATNSWTRKADFPFPVPFHGSIGISLNGKGYVLTGSSTNFVYEFDPQANTWTRKADFPGGQRYRGAGFVIGDKAYVAGGYLGNTVVKDCWEYTPATDTWLQKASLPEALIDAATFSINAIGYLGNGSVEARKMWAYHPLEDKWERKSNIPGYPQVGSALFVLDNKGYVLVPFNQNSFTNEFWQFTP